MGDSNHICDLNRMLVFQMTHVEIEASETKDYMMYHLKSGTESKSKNMN